MTLPAAIEMPNPLMVNAKSFDLNRPQEITPSGSGFITTIDRGSPFWVAQYTTPPLTSTNEDIFQQFLDQLEGAAGTFLGFDPRRPKPRAYASVGGEPWVANPVTPPRIVGATYSTSLINLDRLTVGAVITRGDYISFQDGNIWRLYRATATMTADGSGLITGLAVTPRPLAIGANRVIRLTRACAEMKMIGAPKKDDQLANMGPSFTITAVQYINRS